MRDPVDVSDRFLDSCSALFTGILTVVAKVAPPSYESGTATFTSLPARMMMRSD